MSSPRKVIITCAITGAIHTPTMSPHLPITPDEIATSAIGAARGGCVDRASPRPDARRRSTDTRSRDVSPVSAQDQGGVECRDQSHDRRRADDARRRAASAGTQAQARGRVAQHGLDELRAIRDDSRYKEWKHDWELPYLAGSDERIFKNTFRDIAYILESCSDNGTRFEVECYDIATCTPRLTFSNEACSKHRCLFSRCSAFAVASGRIPRM